MKSSRHASEPVAFACGIKLYWYNYITLRRCTKNAKRLVGEMKRNGLESTNERRRGKYNREKNYIKCIKMSDSREGWICLLWYFSHFFPLYWCWFYAIRSLRSACKWNQMCNRIQDKNGKTSELKRTEQKDFKANQKKKKKLLNWRTKNADTQFGWNVREKYRFCHLAATIDRKRQIVINGISILLCLPVGYCSCHLGFLDSFRSLFLSSLSISSIDNEHQSNRTQQNQLQKWMPNRQGIGNQRVHLW